MHECQVRLRIVCVAKFVFAVPSFRSGGEREPHDEREKLSLAERWCPAPRVGSGQEVEPAVDVGVVWSAQPVLFVVLVLLYFFVVQPSPPVVDHGVKGPLVV